MPFDALTMTAVADELRQKSVGGRIQGVFLPAPLAIGLEIYAHHATQYLFISAHPQHARLHLMQDRLSRGMEEVTPLLLLLRKYVRDGRLAAVEQPALERTLSLIITKADVFGKGRHESEDDGETPTATSEASSAAHELELTTVSLVVEVMGRYSNIILVDENGVVLEAVKHVTSAINRYRQTLPHHPYIAPPPQSKADPRGLSAAAFERAFAAAGEQPAWQTLVRSYLGVSPLLAREAVFRAAGSADAPPAGLQPDALATALGDLLAGHSTHQWSPTLASEGDALIDFAPYELRQFGAAMTHVESISAAVQQYFAQETVASDYAGLKQHAQKLLDTMRDRLTRRRESLQEQEAIGAQAEALRVKGEMLLSFANQIAPRRQAVELSYAPGEPATHIELDPQMSVVENAQNYFKRYAQARDAARAIPALLEEARLDLAYLEQLQHDLAMAATSADVRETQRALEEMAQPKKPEIQEKGGKQRPQKGGARQAPLTVISDDGIEIIVGRNARQNDSVTFQMAAPGDVWLHARGVPGSHVIVRSAGRAAPQRTLEQAAALAAAHSAAHESTSVAVDYTERRFVRRSRGGPGMVTYTNEKTVHARPATAAASPPRRPPRPTSGTS